MTKILPRLPEKEKPEQVNDIYKVEIELCKELLDIYDKSARQLFKLAQAGDSFKLRGQISQTK